MSWEVHGPPSTRTHISSAEPIPPNENARSSRAKGLKNLVHYKTATRTEDDGTTTTVSIGDPVTVDYDACIDHIVTSPLLVWTERHVGSIGSHASSSKARKGKARASDRRDTIEDGIEEGTMYGLLADIYKNEKEKLYVRIQWLYRPKIALHTWNLGAMEKLGLSVANNELFYATDPLALKHQYRPRTSQAQDTIPIAYLDDIFNLQDWSITRFWNPVPENDQDWVQEFDFQDVHSHAIRTGVWELAVENENGSSSESERPSGRSQRKRSRRSRKADHQKKAKAPSDSESQSEEEEDVDDWQGNGSATESGEDASESEKTGSSSSSASSEASEDEEEDDGISRRRQGRKRKAPDDWVPERRPKMVKLSAEARKRRQERIDKRKARLQAREMRRTQPSLPERVKSMEGWTPFQKARSVLHVGATPDFLPGREGEFAEVEAYLEDAIDEGVGSCIYIAGVPGTGKTATVRSVVRALQARAESQEIQPFRFVEINGMKLTEPQQAFACLWEFISGSKASPKAALNNLESHFTKPTPGRETCVVLVDELDRLVTKKNEVIYNFFDWPNHPHSKLIVLAIANTMDLPERQLSGKIRSRLGSNRINFMPYNHNQLIEILKSRLAGLPDTVIHPLAVEIAAKSVAKITGDARRALDICRRAIERVEGENRPVNVGDIQKIQKDMSASGPALWVRDAPLMQKVLLLAVAMCCKKQETESVSFSDVIHWHLKFLKESGLPSEPTEEQFFDMLTSLCGMKLLGTAGSRANILQHVHSEVRNDDLMTALKSDPLLEKRVARIALC